MNWEPVSYTHLDVYKRQVIVKLGKPHHKLITPINGEGSSRPDPILQHISIALYYMMAWHLLLLYTVPATGLDGLWLHISVQTSASNSNTGLPQLTYTYL